MANIRPHIWRMQWQRSQKSFTQAVMIGGLAVRVALRRRCRDSLDNILIIGMTNRLDMIDDALTRPGRLEVKVEIGLPDEEGRVQILNIHTGGMKTSKRLASDVNTTQLASTLRENRDYLLLTAHVVITSHITLRTNPSHNLTRSTYLQFNQSLTLTTHVIALRTNPSHNLTRSTYRRGTTNL